MGARLGQHFLVNKGVIAKILKAAALERSDVVLEIGPGRGALTFALAGAAGTVVAVEKDAELADKLRAELAERNISNVQVITQDILAFLDSRFLLYDSSFKVVANIPYYITSALVRALLEQEHKPQRIVLMMQKEVARRICARDGKESILSLSVKLYAEPKLLFSVAAGSFAPPPKVDSAVLELVPRAAPLADPAAFFHLVKAGFAAPRKKLAGNFLKGLHISKEKVSAALEQLKAGEGARPDELSLAQWIDLTKALESDIE